MTRGLITTKAGPSLKSCHGEPPVLIGPTDGCPVPSRTNPRQSAATKYVTAFRQSTSCEPNKAIPSPLNAGPKMMPRLVVLWISAFAAVNCARGTINGTDDVSAGLNIATATASRRTRAYKRLTVKVLVET